MSPARSSEAHFQRQVLQLAGFYGWRSYHTFDSRRSQPGFPDLVLVRGTELVFAELKTDTGRVRPDQTEWLTALTGVAAANDGVEVHLWRPADFDELHARLARGRHQLAPLYVAPTPPPGDQAA